MIGFAVAVARIVAVGAFMVFAASAAAQQAYPSKSIRFITAFAAGGSTDIIARLIGQKLTQSWGQPVLVDNRPGGNTMVGTDAAAKSAPDGYTIILVGASHNLVPLLLNAPYDPIKDFAPVATVAKSEFVLLLNPSVPANNLKEFIAYAKARPGQLNYATPGAGGGQHLATELLNLIAGIKMQHIPYKGAGPALNDLLGGQVQVFISTIVAAIAHVRSGKLKAVAVSGERRSSALPEVPTFDEGGLSGLRIRAVFGILAPAGTPKTIVNRLSAELAKILAQPDFEEKLTGQGLEAFISTPEQYAILLKEGLATNARIIKNANIKFEN